MITTIESIWEGVSRVSRVTAYLIFGVAISATLIVADDRPESDPLPAVSSPPPAAFAPMTRSERLSNYVAGLGNYEAVVTAVGGAGLSQATNTPKEWGGGAGAYGERVGNIFAQHVIRGTLAYGVSSALHEDNRYFVSRETGFLRRTKYAVLSTLLARHDNGSRSFSFSRIGGSAGAAFISREWQPRSTNTAGDGAVAFGFTMAAPDGL